MTQKGKLKDFTVIDRDSNTLHHQARQALQFVSEIDHQQKHWQSQNHFSIQQASQTEHTIRTATLLHHPLVLLRQKTIYISHLSDLHLK